MGIMVYSSSTPIEGALINLRFIEYLEVAGVP